jgi:hypothetical protein
MQDNFHGTELRALCVAAQHDFNHLAREFKEACDALDAAKAAQAKAAAAINASFDKVRSLACVLRERGEKIPVAIIDGDLWRSLSKGRELGEIHAILEGCAPAKAEAA